MSDPANNLLSRIHELLESRDLAGAVLDEDLRSLAADLLAADGELPDVGLYYVAGMLHWWRSTVLPEGVGQTDLEAASRLLLPVYRVKPDAVPEQLRDVLAEADERAAADRETLLQDAFTLLERAAVRGDRAALDTAAARLRQVIELSKGDSWEHASALNLLGEAFSLGYRLTGSLNALEESLQLTGAALREDPGRPDILLGHCNGLLFWYQRTGDANALDAAIDAGRTAVSVASDEPAIRGPALSALSAAYLMRFRLTGDRDDSNAAVSASQEAVGLVPHGDPGRPEVVANLGGALWAVYEHFGDLRVLEEVIALSREAVAETPKETPYLAVCLSNLGRSLMVRFERLGERSDYDEAVAVTWRACEDVIASPSDRVAAARGDARGDDRGQR